MFDSCQSQISERISQIQENAKKILTITVEAYEFDPWRARLLVLSAVLKSCCNYFQTSLDVQLLSQCTMAIQQNPTIQTRRSFLMLMTFKILVVILGYGLNECNRKLSKAFGANVIRQRDLRLLKTYFGLSYSEQTMRGTRDLFTEVLVFQEVIYSLLGTRKSSSQC